MSKSQMIKEDIQKVLNNYPAEKFSKLHNSNILITGSGFFSTWILEFLTHLNDAYNAQIKISIVSKSFKSFRSNANHLLIRKDLEFIEKDVREIVQLDKDLDWVINTIGDTNTRNHATDPVGTSDSIINGTKNLLDHCIRLDNIKKILHLSSGLVNGRVTDENPIKESEIGIVDFSVASNCYVEAKRFSETLCASYRSEFRLPIVIARPFAFIGPYQSMDSPFALNNFLRDGLSGNLIRVLGDGETVRSYLYGAEAAYLALKILIDSDSGSIVNIGSEEGIKIKDLANLVADSFGNQSKVEVNYFGYKTNYSKLIPDITIAKKKYNFTTVFPLNISLKRTIDWHKSTAN